MQGLRAIILVALVATPAIARAEADPAKADLTKPFDHGTHFAQLRKLGDRLMSCEDCHTVTGSTSARPDICEKPRMPFPSHDRCTPCHAAAFYTRPLRICGNCHTVNELVVSPPLKEQNKPSAPLRPNFSHKLHLDPKERVAAQLKVQKDCIFCHPPTKQGKAFGRPTHAQCCDCHTKPEISPNITQCAICHARPASEHATPSMIRRFSHGDHTVDPRTGATLECMRCHYAVPRANKVREIDMPVMATCVTCHLGEVAFDFANCLKCHHDDIAKKPVPKSHQR